MAHDDLLVEPIHVLAPKIAAGEISPVELTRQCLARIETTDRALHAFVEVYRDEALAAADAAERAIRAGAYLGPLHGVPLALKDLIEFAGRQTTAGSASWTGRISTITATVAERARAAGMVIIGKTHMVEFAYGGWGTNRAMGAPRNPWDGRVHRVPGGSSSGSGVAVAAGMVPAAIGSDTGGSIRIPASMNGLVGLKPTYGRVSNYGVVPLSHTLDSAGPMTRSVEDAALVYRSICGADLNDPDTLAHGPHDPLTSLKRGIKGLRIGVLVRDQLETAAPEVLAAVDSAISVLRGLGAVLEEVRLPRALVDYVPLATTIIQSEAFAHRGDVATRDPKIYDSGAYERILSGRDVPAARYAMALRQRREEQRVVHAQFEDYDAIITPTTPIAAIDITRADEADMPLGNFTRLANFLGLCGLAVPCGFTADGMPLSLQLLGAPFCEERILRIGWAYEQATQWHQRRPDLSAFQ